MKISTEVTKKLVREGVTRLQELSNSEFYRKQGSNDIYRKLFIDAEGVVSMNMSTLAIIQSAYGTQVTPVMVTEVKVSIVVVGV